MKPFVVVYLNDSNDLYHKDFQTENEVHEFMEDKGLKFIVIHGNISSVDDFYSC